MSAKLDGELVNDTVIQRIEKRAREFPFYSNVGSFLPPTVQNYAVSAEYKHHFDWFDDPRVWRGNVASTFFVYIHANCTGGGTQFPLIDLPDDETWCEFVDCDRPLHEGVTFRPILGNAVYFENLRADDTGHPSTYHAGMPVTSGRKMGMNLWTWKPV